MTNQSRRRPSRNVPRRERRTGAVQGYTPVSASTPTFRRSYMAEPAPVDYAAEYRFIRKDLLRILLWATVLIGAMVLLSFLPIADNFATLFG